MKFKESVLAHRYLDSETNEILEIGASAHNPFNIKCKTYINVDFTRDSIFHKSQLDMCGEIAEVDFVSPGDNLPFIDEGIDGVINSHVLEHFFDPIKALKEWMRVLKPGGILFMVIPHKERTFDKDRPLTPYAELLLRHKGLLTREDYLSTDDHAHWSVWDTHSFLELMNVLNLHVVESLDIDDKVGNGFTVVVEKR